MVTTNRCKKPFSPEELRILGKKPGFFPGMAPSFVFNTPISYRENVIRAIWDKSPCFALTNRDFTEVDVPFYEAKLSRAYGGEMEKVDTFGVKWIFEPIAGGSISEAGKPKFEDVNQWKDVISMPDVDDWDWAADAVSAAVNTDFAVQTTMINGFWFERMVSLMDFVNAAVALVDDDQTDAIGELFEATTELACKIVDKVCQFWPCLDGFVLHDDWGSQREPFFSDAIARELFLPHMKKLIGHIHDKGRYCSLHSCGHVEDRLDVFIDAGLDSWEMQASANHIAKLYKDYGDKILLQVTVPDFAPGDEKAAVQAARDYVDHFCKPGKPTMLLCRGGLGNQVFAEELYTYSRKHYLTL